MEAYFRRDQATGITAPDLRKACFHAEHIVRARGKRTQYTSVSLDTDKVHDIGETTYKLKCQDLLGDKHVLVGHSDLLAGLRSTAKTTQKAERVRAIQAIRYATKRREGLVQWVFDVAGVDQKDVINWAQPKVAAYFTKV